MTEQLTMIPAFTAPAKKRVFHGAGFDAKRDQKRLDSQIDRVLSVTRDGRWRTLETLIRELKARFPEGHFPEASISAQLRNLRKEGHTMERRHVSHGLFEYRVEAKA